MSSESGAERAATACRAPRPLTSATPCRKRRSEKMCSPNDMRGPAAWNQANAAASGPFLAATASYLHSEWRGMDARHRTLTEVPRAVRPYRYGAEGQGSALADTPAQGNG